MDKQNIETIYPLAPLQQAFLWHSLQTSVQDGLIHMRCTLRGELDSTTLQQAWETVISRHPVLRTSVHWAAVKQPLQVVAKRTSLPWTELDWRSKPNQTAVMADFLDDDRDRGFDLTQAPITRLALIRLTDTDHELIWSCHHLMLDGWSGALVLNQVIDHYEALQSAKPLPASTAPTFQTYIRWLKQQDEEAAAGFWRKTLKGFAVPTPLPERGSREAGEQRSGGAEKQGKPNIEQQITNNEQQTQNSSILLPSYPPTLRLTAAETATLQSFLRSHRLTLNTFLQGIWALLLYSYSGSADVLFGATVSGRQGDLPGVEAIVGLLINVLPVRVQVDVEQNILTWLQDLQVEQAAASRYGYASPDQIQSWSEVSGRLFESLLVIENYPIQASEGDRTLVVDNMQSGLVSTYGLTVIVKPGDRLMVMLQAEASRFDASILPVLLEQFEALMEAITNHPECSIRSILPSSRTAPTESASVARSRPKAPALNREDLEGRFFAPSNALELKLTQIWEAVLGIRPLSVEASFFDLGGDSLLAVQLFNQMQQQLDCTLPLAALFQAPNVRQFAALLDQKQPISQWSSLVPIQTSGSRRPFFFHGGSADALTWARFSHLLGPAQPFYALQRPDISSGKVEAQTVEALAQFCVEEIRMVQPSGPYLIGGHCFGGAVAFEIAQQLQAQGETVASVVIIDAYRPAAIPNTMSVKLQSQLQLGLFWIRKNYYYHGGWAKLALLPGKVLQRLQLVRSASSSTSVSSKIDTLRPHRPTPDVEANASASATVTSSHATESQPSPPYEYRYAIAQQANELATANYRPQPYAGQIKLFRANIQILDWYFGPALGWQSVTSNTVEVTQVPGFFGNLFNQQSGPLLAEQVKTYLSTIS